MGTTFSTIQIRNRMQLSPEEFKREICKCFFKKGLIPATEKDAEYFYWLAFFDEKKWVTMGSGEYSSERPNDKLYTEIQEIAKELNTHCIVSHVWDSDFLELNCSSRRGNRRILLLADVRPATKCSFRGYPKSGNRFWRQAKHGSSLEKYRIVIICLPRRHSAKLLRFSV